MVHERRVVSKGAVQNALCGIETLIYGHLEGEVALAGDRSERRSTLRSIAIPDRFSVSLREVIGTALEGDESWSGAAGLDP